MHSRSPSAYPWIKASGVFSSWDTFDKNSLRISSIWVFFSMSIWSSLLALFSSEIVFSNVSESWFICSPNWSISFSPLIRYFALKSKSVIRLEISVSSRIGSAIFLDAKLLIIALTITAKIPIYAKKRLDIHTLSRILSKAVRINIRFPSESVPHKIRYSAFNLVSACFSNT